tara:strand:+ start:501 stop:1286 length:786 start_codon:yes stop_codon:yes gene_type:complete
MSTTVFYRDLAQSDIKSENIKYNAFVANLKTYKNTFCNKVYDKDDSFMGNQSIYRSCIPTVSNSSQNYMKIGKHFIKHFDYLKMLEEIETTCPGQYLLGPGYNNTFELEMQLGVTGTCKKYEPFKDSIVREFREELGLSFSNIKRIKKIGTVQFYKVHLQPNHYSTIPFVTNHYKDTLQDRKGFKVVGLVYGSKKHILEAMKKTKLPKGWMEGESISHICTMKVSVAIAVMKKLMEPEFYCNGNHLKGCMLFHKKSNQIII